MNIPPNELLKKLLEVQEKNLEIAEQTRNENALAKDAQRQQSSFDVQDRIVDAQFGLTKAWGQATLTAIGMGAQFVSPKYQKYVKGPLEGVGQIFNGAVSILEANRSLNVALRQSRDLDSNKNIGIHIDRTP